MASSVLIYGLSYRWSCGNRHRASTTAKPLICWPVFLTKPYYLPSSPGKSGWGEPGKEAPAALGGELLNHGHPNRVRVAYHYHCHDYSGSDRCSCCGSEEHRSICTNYPERNRPFAGRHCSGRNRLPSSGVDRAEPSNIPADHTQGSKVELIWGENCRAVDSGILEYSVHRNSWAGRVGC